MTRQTYGALCALAEQHGVKMTEEVRSFVRAVEQADAGGTPIELLGVKETTEEGGGQWRTCTGCYESEDGHPVGRYPYSEVMGCTLGGGCQECGGIGAIWDTTDYNAMADWLAARDGQNVPAQQHAEPGVGEPAAAVSAPAPSDEEIFELWCSMPTQGGIDDDIVPFARALLARYAIAGAEMQSESPQSQAAQGNTVVVGVKITVPEGCRCDIVASSIQKEGAL